MPRPPDAPAGDRALNRLELAAGHVDAALDELEALEEALPGLLRAPLQQARAELLVGRRKLANLVGLLRKIRGRGGRGDPPAAA